MGQLQKQSKQKNHFKFSREKRSSFYVLKRLANLCSFLAYPRVLLPFPVLGSASFAKLHSFLFAEPRFSWDRCPRPSLLRPHLPVCRGRCEPKRQQVEQADSRLRSCSVSSPKRLEGSRQWG